MGFPGSSLVISLVVQGFPCGSAGKESTCNEGDLGSIPGLGRALGGGHDNSLQHSCLENPHGQRSLAGYNPWGHKVRHDWATKHSTYVNPDLPIYPSPHLLPLVMVLLIIKLILLLTPASPAVGAPALASGFFATTATWEAHIEYYLTIKMRNWKLMNTQSTGRILK